VSAVIKKENTWVFKVDKVVEVGTIEAPERCIKLFAQIVKKSARSPLSREKTVRFTARTVFPNIKTAAADSGGFVRSKSPSADRWRAF
jgi:hypothetical protein